MKYSYYYIETETTSKIFKGIILPNSKITKYKKYKIIHSTYIFDDNLKSIINFIENNPYFKKEFKIKEILNCEFININLKRKIKLYLNLNGVANV